MKRFIAALLCLAMIIGCLTACSSDDKGADTKTGDTASTEKSGDTASTVTTPAADEKKVINLWAFTDEVPKMVDRYKELNPSFDYEIKTTIIATTDGAYQPALDAALAAGGDEAPDMYCAEAAFILKYSQGDASQYAAAYKDLGIDVDKMIADAAISDYSVQIGTRPSDGQVVGLGYQATGGCFIYRRSI
ncbi:MAG: carbohydrate ABC transporter substrate-binding protein, partial [Lachnospiraceae bacterium]|nr:carbohydrate ABC transporter substrate-binding protein [Lachnospiraceae bacterium]